jgi:hypothetical protein
MSPSDDAEVRAILLRIASMLEAGHEQRLALVVRKVLSGSTQRLEEFL